MQECRGIRVQSSQNSGFSKPKRQGVGEAERHLPFTLGASSRPAAFIVAIAFLVHINKTPLQEGNGQSCCNGAGEPTSPSTLQRGCHGSKHSTTYYNIRSIWGRSRSSDYQNCFNDPKRARMAKNRPQLFAVSHVSIGRWHTVSGKYAIC